MMRSCAASCWSKDGASARCVYLGILYTSTGTELASATARKCASSDAGDVPAE